MVEEITGALDAEPVKEDIVKKMEDGNGSGRGESQGEYADRMARRLGVSMPPTPANRTNWICEQHPWLAWPHDRCDGPGMPKDALRGLHTRATLISYKDYYNFRHLLFEAGRLNLLVDAVAPLKDHVPRIQDGPFDTEKEGKR